MDDSEIEWSGGEYVPHPPGIYRAEFTAFQKVDPDENSPYGKKTRIKLSFQTEAEMDNGEPFGINVFTAPSFHPKGKVRPFLTALGEDVDKIDPATFRLSAFLGRKVVLVIEHEPRKDGNGDRAVVKSFQPIPAKSSKKKPVFDEDDE